MIESAPAYPADASASPEVIHVTADELATSPKVAWLVRDLRARADAFVFLSGGASKMPPEARARVLALMDAFALLARRGLRFAVGDGGTQAGIMEAAGLARQAAGGAFPLIGVTPAPEITPTGGPGKTPIDPHHSHLIAVDNPAWVESRRAGGWRPADGYWGSETEAMYAVFARLAEGRPSVALVANGGDIVLDEVRENLTQRRPIVLVAGSGRAADAIVSLLEGTTPDDEDTQRLRATAATLDVLTRRELFHVFTLEGGSAALATTLERFLRRP